MVVIVDSGAFVCVVLMVVTRRYVGAVFVPDVVVFEDGFRVVYNVFVLEVVDVSYIVLTLL